MALLVSPLHPFLLLSDLTLSGRIHAAHPWRDTHISVVGSAQVLWVASWYAVKMECEMSHFPSCSAKLCFRERWKSHYVTCLTWPYKL